MLLQIGDRAFADHAPVGDDAHLADAEAPPQAIDNRDQGGHVGGIARPQLAADRPAVAVEHGADHHLPLVRPMILTVAILPQTLAAVAFEIQRRGIEEDHFHLGEQIAAAAEKMFLEDVLGRARYEVARTLLLIFGQHLAQPAHGSVQVVQFQLVHSRQDIVALPALGGAVAARRQEPVQDGQEDGPLHGKLEMPAAQRRANHGLAAGILPEFFEDQRRPPAAGSDDGEIVLLMFREDQQLLGEACTGGEQAIDLVIGLQLVEPAQRSQDGLLRPAVAPVVFDDLQIGTWSGLFGAEEHGELLCETLGV